MTDHASSSSSVSIGQRLVEWLGQQFGRSELDGLDTGTIDRLAMDLGVTVDDLTSLSQQSEAQAALFDRMLALHGLNKEALEREMPAVMRDMEVACSHCSCKKHCASELDHGVTAQNAAAFCPNSDTLTTL